VQILESSNQIANLLFDSTRNQFSNIYRHQFS